MNKPIPTVYKGVRFRSRLEAKWAAFFDVQHWEWSYEELDLFGYIPDFLLRFDVPIIVEVKPILYREDFDPMHRERRKILDSGWKGEALVVGNSIWERECGAGHFQLGWMHSPGYGWGEAFAFRCNDCGNQSLAQAEGNWVCRVKGCGWGDEHIDRLTDDYAADFQRAANQVQWNPAA